MSIAFQCREVATGPVVGYQVGAQGDGSGYIRQQQQQHQQTQDAMIRGLSCISIYVQSNPDGVPGQKGADGSSLRPFGGGQEVFKAVGQDHQVGFQPASAVLDFPTDKDFDCNFRVECNSSSQHGNHERSAEGPLEYLGNFGDHKESASVSSNSITDDNCSSSSIGDDDDEDTSGDMEVESKLKGPLDSMAELEDSLPIKRGLSNFFTGKSKSFTCLSDVVSVKDLAKPENPYNKRRRNLLAYGNSWERNRFHPPRNSSAGISKKAMHTSKSTLALAVAMSKSEDSSEKDENDAHLPPLPPQGKWQRSFASPRSFSLTDLQGV